MTTTPLVAPTFLASPHSTTKAEMDAAFALLVDRINSLTAIVDTLAGITPGTYATSSDLAAHVATGVPHASIMKFPQVPGGSYALVQHASLTLDGSGNVTWTYPTAMGTLITYQLTPVTNSNLPVTASSATALTITGGTAGTVVKALVIGYL